ncbi:MAG: hypothetical protein AAB824_01960 [Patescibacteria group bacterium]
MLGACTRLTLVPKSLPSPDQSPSISGAEPDKSAAEYYDIYLSRKAFDQIDLANIITMDEETSTYIITCKSYEIDLKKSILTANGVMVIADTTLQAIGENGENLAPIKMWADKIQIDISLLTGWNTCVVVEKTGDQYFISVYGRVHKPGVGAPYELVLPRTKIIA